MKVLLFFGVVTLYVAYVLTQCPGRPPRLTCVGPRDVGNANGPNCQQNAGRRWWYNATSRECEEIAYLGCGGNSNRFCGLRGCRRICIRRPTTT